MAGRQRLTIQLWLKPDIAAAERYATAVATPGGALFHHYLSPAAYTARFAASQAAASGVESWLRAVDCRAAINANCQPNVLVTFDDQSPIMTRQVTLPGYDNMTGLGTPRGQPSSSTCASSPGTVLRCGVAIEMTSRIRGM